jgi:hypothetical protein
MKNWIIIFFILGAMTCHAQWKDITLEEFSTVILDVEKRIPQGESYGYVANYLFFEELNSTDTTLKYDFNLNYQVRNKLFNMTQFGRDVVQNKDFQVVCDTAEKQIIINYPNEEYYKRKTTDDFALLLKSKCTAQKKEQGKTTIYYLTFADGARYKGAELWIENTGMVVKYIMYTGIEVLDDTKESDRYIHPRMEVHFSNYQFGKKVDDKKLKNVDYYFLDINKLVLKDTYKNFEIIDLRNNQQ